jgi:hypothetical protein
LAERFHTTWTRSATESAGAANAAAGPGELQKNEIIFGIPKFRM